MTRSDGIWKLERRRASRGHGHPRRPCAAVRPGALDDLAPMNVATRKIPSRRPGQASLHPIIGPEVPIRAGPRSEAGPQSVYLRPEDAWGLVFWLAVKPPQDTLARLLSAEHDAFYRMLAKLRTRGGARNGRIVVLDLHSYNHRGGEGRRRRRPIPGANPQVNVGTPSRNLHPRWRAAGRGRFHADL